MRRRPDGGPADEADVVGLHDHDQLGQVQVGVVNLPAAMTAKVGSRQLGKAGQSGAGAQAHRLSVDGVGPRRDDVERDRGRPSRRCSSMKPAMTERAALPVHSTKRSVIGGVEQHGRRVEVERVLGVAGGTGEEHQIATLGALHDHGGDDGHQDAGEGVAPGVGAQLFERVVRDPPRHSASW